jgi:hypothetical protein
MAFRSRVTFAKWPAGRRWDRAVMAASSNAGPLALTSAIWPKSGRPAILPMTVHHSNASGYFSLNQSSIESHSKSSRHAVSPLLQPESAAATFSRDSACAW